MTTFNDLKEFFGKQGYKFIMVADAETLIHERNGELVTAKVPAGGVSIALDPIAKASDCVYIARGKTQVDKEVLDKNSKIRVEGENGSYTLKRVFITDEEFDAYYNGFSNQTLWPLCHVAFEPPEFSNEWFEGYKAVNKKFADAIRTEIKGKTFIWIHDYQLALVPKLLGQHKDVVIGMFWHIPWPTWEVFRILPQKKEILESILSCNYLAFHRGYQARNFIKTVEREFQVRTDRETNKIYTKDTVIKVDNLPLGIDGDVIKGLLERQEKPKQSIITQIASKVFGEPDKEDEIEAFFEKNKVILGVDRLDYTKGLVLRLKALRRFYKKFPQYREKVTYLGLLAPSREKIPSYLLLKKQIDETVVDINNEFSTKKWKPIHIIQSTFPRGELLNFYKKAAVCLVTPRDDGMNLVSKEFVISSSTSSNPGMLVLSQFAGSAIDLTSAIIINPYDIENVANAIKDALEMSKAEKQRRIKNMVENLDEKNVYDWAMEFVKNATIAKRESLASKNK